MAEANIAQSGIYCIRNIVSGRRYVGSSVNIPKRWRSHLSLLRNGTHNARAMQRSWLKHGEGAFEFTILELVPDLHRLVEREQFWMDKLEACSRRGFNSSPTAGNCLGVRHTAETKAKQSALRRGIPKSPEHRKAIGEAHRGRKLSAERRQQIGAATRRFFEENPAARERMREVGHRNGLLTRGRVMAPEFGRHLSEIKKGSEHYAEIGRRNLAKMTPEQIALGKARSGGKPGQPNRRLRVLTFEQAEEIRQRKSEGWTYDRLVESYGLDRCSLFQIVKGRTYQRP